MQNVILSTVPVADRPFAKAAMAIAAEPNPFDAGSAAYTPRFLASVSLPYRRPTPAQLDEYGAWIRTNGKYRLMVQQGVNRLGIPFGMFPRLFLIWLTTEVKHKKLTRVSFGNDFWGFCKKLDVDTSRGKRGSGRALAIQVASVLDANFAYGEVETHRGGGRMKGEKLDVADDYRLFWHTGVSKEADQLDLFESFVDIDPKFYAEVLTHYVPIDLRMVLACKERRSPMELDVYTWTNYRLYAVTKAEQSVLVPWQSIAAQFPGDYARPRRFRTDFADAMKRVLSAPLAARLDPKVTISEVGIRFDPSPKFIQDKRGS